MSLHTEITSDVLDQESKSHFEKVQTHIVIWILPRE